MEAEGDDLERPQVQRAVVPRAGVHRSLQQVHLGHRRVLERRAHPNRRTRAERLVQPNDDVARTVLGELDRLDVRRPLDADERLDGRSTTAAEGEVQRVPRLGGLRDPGAGDQRPPQHVPALVRLRVGEQRRAQQAEPDPRERAAALTRMAGDVVAIGRVVGQPDAVPAVGHVDPPVRAHLEARRVPGGVLVRRPDDVPELGLVRRVVGVHVDVEGRLEHLLAFVPVDLGLDLQTVADESDPLPG